MTPVDMDALPAAALPSVPTEQTEGPVVSGSADTAIITGFVGMKCDAPDCSWSDTTVQRAEYPAYRNKPCPNCGTNLLTDEDWNIVLSMEAAAAWVNENAERLGLKTDAPGEPFDVDFDVVRAAVVAGRTTAASAVGIGPSADEPSIAPPSADTPTARPEEAK